MGEHRALDLTELAGFLVEDRHADDVGGQEIRRELHAPELAAQRAGQRLDERGLPAAGQVVQQHVPADEYGHQDQRELFLLTDEDLRDLPPERLRVFLGFHGLTPFEPDFRACPPNLFGRGQYITAARA